MNEPKGVFFFFSMLDNFNMLMEQNQTQAAYEYINAIRDYVIEGKVYEGNDLFVQLLMNGDMKVMDSVQEKRQMGSNGGKANLDLDLDDRIQEAISGYTFKTKAAIVKFVEGKRTTVLDHIKKLGYSDEDWLEPNQMKEVEPRVSPLTKSDGEVNGFRQNNDEKLTDECPTPPLTNPLTFGQLTESDKDKDSRQSKVINGSPTPETKPSPQEIATIRKKLL
jgi:hypothetical protein